MEPKPVWQCGGGGDGQSIFSTQSQLWAVCRRPKVRRAEKMHRLVCLANAFCHPEWKVSAMLLLSSAETVTTTFHIFSRSLNPFFLACFLRITFFPFIKMYGSIPIDEQEHVISIGRTLSVRSFDFDRVLQINVKEKTQTHTWKVIESRTKWIEIGWVESEEKIWLTCTRCQMPLSAIKSNGLVRSAEHRLGLSKRIMFL